MLEAYCWPQSVGPGDEFAVHVSSDPARPFTVTVARDGASLDVVWTGSGDADRTIPPRSGRPREGCGWPAALRIPVGEDWRSGSSRQRSRAATNARMRSSWCARVGRARAPVLMVLGTSTWNAYNDWGGPSLYTGGTRVSFERPLAPGFLTKPEPARRKAQDEPGPRGARLFRMGRHSRRVELERRRRMAHVGAAVPALGRGAGIGVDVAVSQDLDAYPEVLAGHRLFLSVGHDEYWSRGMRETVERHTAGGGNAAFFTGNTCYWQVRFEDRPTAP